MRKKNKGRKFGREKAQRKALLKSLISALFIKEKIKTTEAKAKEISPIAEKFITSAKNIPLFPHSSVATRRVLARYFSPKVVKKLVNEIAPRYQERKGGYTRIIRLGPRKSDGAEMAIIELVK